MTIRLSRRARADLEDVRTFTRARWGADQWLAYYKKIVHAFELIAAQPEQGRDRSLFAPGMRSINCGRHVIFYKRLEAAKGEPVVLRIVHQRRHLPGLLYHDDLDIG
ncbi:MAG: type II toxin-antitoxin system RelE/ParE family toxin [Oceanicaulis sp.]